MEQYKVAIQGGHGAYHAIAAEKYFVRNPLKLIFCSTFLDVFKSLEKDSTTLGMVAIENTIAGSLLPNYELLRKYPFPIIGEYKLRISHCLATLPSQNIEDIVEVMSHPIALMQCADFLDKIPNVRIIAHEDTALAAREIAHNKIQNSAAICSVQAAEYYGLRILARGIETNKHNFTRFLIIGNTEGHTTSLSPQQNTLNKSSLVFTLTHEQGSLSGVLSILSFYKMNLTKIQSLPIIGKEWEYQFYIDVTFSSLDRFYQAVDAIRPLVSELRILGVYVENLHCEEI